MSLSVPPPSTTERVDSTAISTAPASWRFPPRTDPSVPNCQQVDQVDEGNSFSIHPDSHSTGGCASAATQRHYQVAPVPHQGEFEFGAALPLAGPAGRPGWNGSTVFRSSSAVLRRTTTPLRCRKLEGLQVRARASASPGIALGRASPATTPMRPPIWDSEPIRERRSPTRSTHRRQTTPFSGTPVLFHNAIRETQTAPRSHPPDSPPTLRVSRSRRCGASGHQFDRSMPRQGRSLESAGGDLERPLREHAAHLAGIVIDGFPVNLAGSAACVGACCSARRRLPAVSAP